MTTICALKKELAITGNQLSRIRRVHIIGLTCVNNKDITTWATIPGTIIQARAYALDKSSLNLFGLGESALDRLDEHFSGLASLSGPLKSDVEEMERIVPYLVRPAISDGYLAEMSWADMINAMKGIRRLLSQGTDNSGLVFTRPYGTFQPYFKGKLKDIYDSTLSISHIASWTLKIGLLSDSNGRLIDGRRARIREIVDELSSAAGMSKPVWH